MRLPDPYLHHTDDENDSDDQLPLRMIWLLMVGWWLSAIWVTVAWLSMILFPGSAVGLRMLAHVPRVVALKAPQPHNLQLVQEAASRLEHSRTSQRPAVVRLVYTLAIGWWFSMIWSVVAWFRSLSLHTRPTATTMFVRVPAVMTLRRY